MQRLDPETLQTRPPAQHVRCKDPECGALIHFERNEKTGRMMPLNLDGTPHWATCPGAKGFRKQRRDADKGGR